MNSVQESKNELDAAIRYAENAISSAKQTIESMEFRQQMAQKNYQEQTGRESMLEGEVAELTTQVDEAFRKNQSLQAEVNELCDVIDRMSNDTTGDSVTIKNLQEQNAELRLAIEEQRTNMALMEDKIQGQYDDIVQLERDLTVKTSQAEAWKKEARDPKEGAPTMPVIPRDVAIAIFREGTLFGVEAACDEIQGETINISESDYVGDFSISFERDIDLDDHIDFDWVRSKVGDYDEDNVTANLEGLCAKNNFECRIHGIDDQEEKKND